MRSYYEFVKLPVNTYPIKGCVTNKRVRFHLIAEFKDRSPKLPYFFAICMNPSEACAYHSDPTVNALINHAYYKKEYRGLFLFNMYPVYETQSQKLIEIIKKGEFSNDEADNIKTIKRELEEYKCKEILLAWGNIKDQLFNEIKEILDFLEKNNITMFVLSSDKVYPCHPIGITKEPCADSDKDLKPIFILQHYDKLKEYKDEIMKIINKKQIYETFYLCSFERNVLLPTVNIQVQY